MISRPSLMKTVFPLFSVLATMKKNTLIPYIKRHIHSLVKHIRDLLLFSLMETRSQTRNRYEEEEAMLTQDMRIPVDIELSDEHKELCDASPLERILLYAAYPNEFIKNLYDSIRTLSWKI